MIEASDLGFGYADGGWVFRGVGLDVAAGEIVAILGPNGRGKTTLLKCILGLLKPRRGRVALQGLAGYVPQSTQSAFPYRVLDMVMMGRARKVGLFSTPGRHDREVCRRALDRLGIADFSERAFDALSGGERQLVLVARALASDCNALILDEPASALDYRNQDRMLGMLRDIAREDGLAVLFTTHAPQHALHIADKALLMTGEGDHLFGPTDAVMSEDNLGRLYGLPIKRVPLDGTTAVVPMFG